MRKFPSAFHAPHPGNPGRLDHEHEDQEAQRDRIAVAGRNNAGAHRLEQAEKHAADDRPRHAAEAADDSRSKAFEGHRAAHVMRGHGDRRAAAIVAAEPAAVVHWSWRPQWLHRNKPSSSSSPARAASRPDAVHKLLGWI
jgi:hypothetical protein